MAARVRRHRPDAGAARRAPDAARDGGQVHRALGRRLAARRHRRAADRREAPARRPAVADHVTLGDGASRWRSCAARPTSPPASGSRSPCPGPCCPATGGSSAPRRWASSRNGMLCSGEELRLTTRRRRDPDPARRHAARGAARGPLRRRRARRGRQAEPRRRAVDPGPRARGRRGDRRAGPAARRSWSRRGAARRPPSGCAVDVRDPDLCTRFVGRWVERRDRRPVAGSRPDAPPRRRPAPDRRTSSTPRTT